MRYRGDDHRLIGQRNDDHCKALARMAEKPFKPLSLGLLGTANASNQHPKPLPCLILPNRLPPSCLRSSHPGEFYASGTLDMHPFQLHVEGLGRIAMPLLPVQAEELVALAEQAPYGRGT